MPGRWLFLILLLIGCKEEEIPKGLYNYQVERLLTGGDSKTWILISENRDGVAVNLSSCQDSLRLVISIVESDSINVSRLTSNTDCSSFNSEEFGNANASGDLVFTDSILFASGEVWVINQISSLNLVIEKDFQTTKWKHFE